MVKWIRAIISYIIAISMLFPFLWMVSTSFKEPGKVFSFPIQLIPDPVKFDGYIYVWKASLIGVSFGTLYLNSIKIAAIVLVGTYFSCSIAAYAYAKINFWGRNVLFLLKISSMMIPFQVIMLPTFMVYRHMGFIDTHISLWIHAFLGTAFGTFLLKQFFSAIPDELCEAARIDGAGHARIYWSIAMPMIRPAIATLLTMTIISTWNDYESPLLFIRSPELYTIPIGLKVMADDVFRINYPGIMAGVVSSVIPILLLLVFFNKYIMKGFTFTGVKG
ncbi:carbohydrate ABC transporter permease [Paenibacillus sp. J5C_2022]|uniref:carbohydrate ABC transporter permease n=1 Tax=Paenibacillus sp. J5C2022 TaxID=2977129 RepID=UPI0021CFC761|nr:carbohydrate ABC transporter permease [Paenibacillus sp. J5C2022]MCU6708815.1 carbohydrate ABC transporter permease [Paenibacillus sp. J5C2022]